MTTLHEAVTAALRSADIDSYDGRPETTPPNRYVVLWYDPGHPSDARLAQPCRRVRVEVTAVCVGRTRDGCRALSGAVRRALAWLRPPGTESVLIEQDAGPLLTDKEAGDVRHSISITYAVTIPQENL